MTTRSTHIGRTNLQALARPLTLGALALLGSTGAVAEEKTDGLWRGSGGAAFSATSGNTRSSSLQLSADATRASTTDKFTLGASANYAKNKTDGVNETTSDKWSLFGQYDYKFTPVFYAFGRLGLESDKLVDLSLRSALAGGLGYKLVNSKATTFELLGGGAYTIDKYRVAQTIGDDTDTRFSRASIYVAELSSHQLTSSVQFKQRLDVFPGVSGDKAVLAKFTAGLTVAMTRTLNLSVGLVDNYNSKPPAGTKSNDLGVFTGINVKFGAD
jgi:putative salt-induced outer membrane protein